MAKIIKTETKVCRFCKIEKNILDFVTSGKYKGKYYYYRCKSCNAEYTRNARLKNCYGITLEYYNKLLEEQDFKCAVCKKDETAVQYGIIKTLSVDHCHETGRVRGLLCMRCNSLLGYAGDDLNILESAMNYLNQERSN